MKNSSLNENSGHRHHRNRHRWEISLGRRLVAASGCVLILFMAFLPFLWGGRHPLPVGLAGLAALAAFLLWSFGILFKGSSGFKAAAGTGLLTLAVLLGAFQLSPAFSGRVMSQDYSALWASAAISGAAPMLASLEGYQENVLLWLCTALIWYFLAAQIFRDTGHTSEDRLPRRLLALAAAAGLTAGCCGAASFIQFFGGYQDLFFLWQPKASVMSGPYWNRNHFCQLQEMGLFLDLGLLFALSTTRKGSTLRKCVGGTMRKVLMGIFALSAVIAIVCILCSVSRTGIMVSAAGLVLFILYAFMMKKGRALSLPMILVGTALLLGAFYGLQGVFDRIEFALSGEDTSGLTRWEMWKTSLSVIATSPWLGSGFAGMRMLAPHFDLSYMPGFVTYDVHNDYIDLAVMLGIPFALLVFARILWKLAAVLRVLLSRSSVHSSLHPWAAGVLLGMLAAGGHEVMDYGLKQPANLILFLALAVQLSALCSYLRQKDAEGGGTRWSFGRPLFAVPVLLIAPALWMGMLCLNEVSAGYELARLQDLQNIPAIRSAYTPERWNEAIIKQADKVLAHAPLRPEALEAKSMAHGGLAFIRQSELLAAEVGRILEKPVTAGRVWNAPYRPYLERAFRSLAPEDRLAVVKEYAEAGDAACGVLRAMPLNGLAMSDTAKYLDEISGWNAGTLTKIDLVSGSDSGSEKDSSVTDGTPAHGFLKSVWNGESSSIPAAALNLYSHALELYPNHTFILERAIGGYQRAWYEERNPEKKRRYAETMVTLIRRFGEQQPSGLRNIFPLVWNVHHDMELIRNLAPDDIRAQECLGDFLLAKGFQKEAGIAYGRMEQLNAARLDEETPETLGGVGFMKRERRDKAMLSRFILEKRIAAAKAAGDSVLTGSLGKELEQARRIELTPVINDADDLIRRGEYILAEQRLRKIQEDKRALVRWAEILLSEGRLEQLARVIRRIEEHPQDLEKAELDRWTVLKGKLAERSLLPEE